MCSHLKKKIKNKKTVSHTEVTISLGCRRKDYRRPVSHLRRKKKRVVSHWSDMKANAITVFLACRRKDHKTPVSHLGKKKKMLITYTEMTWNPITKSLTCRRKDYKKQKSLACRRKYYKRQKEEKNRPLSVSLRSSSWFKKTKNTLFFCWLTHQLVLAIDLMCLQIFISGSFFVFSSFASFVFFIVCWVFFFFGWRGVCFAIAHCCWVKSTSSCGKRTNKETKGFYFTKSEKET